jgi:hypothetical protein
LLLKARKWETPAAPKARQGLWVSPPPRKSAQRSGADNQKIHIIYSSKHYNKKEAKEFKQKLKFNFEKTFILKE